MRGTEYKTIRIRNKCYDSIMNLTDYIRKVNRFHIPYKAIDGLTFDLHKYNLVIDLDGPAICVEVYKKYLFGVFQTLVGGIELRPGNPFKPEVTYLPYRNDGKPLECFHEPIDYDHISGCLDLIIPGWFPTY